MDTTILIISVALNVIGTLLLARNLYTVHPKQPGTYIFSPEEVTEMQKKANIKAKRDTKLNRVGIMIIALASILQIFVALTA